MATCGNHFPLLHFNDIIYQKVDTGVSLSIETSHVRQMSLRSYEYINNSYKESFLRLLCLILSFTVTVMTQMIMQLMSQSTDDQCDDISQFRTHNIIMLKITLFFAFSLT